MFKQMFEAMNDMLDEIIIAYPSAEGTEKNQLTDQLNVLKGFSDTFIEEWLCFEEKMGKIYGNVQVSTETSSSKTSSIELSDAFDKGEGYFKLSMYEDAIQQFKRVVDHDSDFSIARLYMALCYSHMGKQDEAYRHFKWITSFTDDFKIKAACYHNMGCIQAKMNNLDKACEYFEKAYKIDPSSSFYSLS